jgi:hypothetical protein
MTELIYHRSSLCYNQMSDNETCRTHFAVFGGHQLDIQRSVFSFVGFRGPVSWAVLK